jgi:hypothetical protein
MQPYERIDICKYVESLPNPFPTNMREALIQYLNDVILKPITGSGKASYRQIGKSNYSLSMISSLWLRIEICSRTMSEIPFSDMPLYINSEDVVTREAAKWILKESHRYRLKPRLKWSGSLEEVSPYAVPRLFSTLCKCMT